MRASYQRTVIADPVAPSIVRHELRAWLNELGWPRDEADCMLLAVTEAVTNAVEHAYREPAPKGVITVCATEVNHPNDGRHLLVNVSDHGRWRPTPVESENRRRGIPLMRALTSSLVIDRSPVGTRVTMTSSSVGVADRVNNRRPVRGTASKPRRQ